MTHALTIVGGVLLSLGVLLILITAIGLVRFPDVLSRMHAATKPQMMGMLLAFSGLACVLQSWAAVGLLVVAMVAQIFTAPVSAHMVGRAAFRNGLVKKELLIRDDLSTRIASLGDKDDDEDGFID